VHFDFDLLSCWEDVQCCYRIFFSSVFVVEQVKGTVEIQERIIASYKEARSDPELAEQILMAVSVGGTTSTSTIYENYLDGLHGNNLEAGNRVDIISVLKVGEK